VRYQDIRVRDGRLQGAGDTEDLGFAVRVILDGAWGFASGVVLTPESAVQVAETAVRTAQVAAAMTTRPVALAPEPMHSDVEWVSSYEVDPFSVPLAEKVALLTGWSRDLLAAQLRRTLERVASPGAGEQVLRRPVRQHHDPAAGSGRSPSVEAHGSDELRAAFDSMRSLAPRPGAGGSTSLAARSTTGPRARRAARAAGREAGRRLRWSRAPTTSSSTRPTCG
jgi:TldD protein